MYKVISIIIVVGLFLSLTGFALAKTETGSLDSVIQSLQEQIEQLKVQIEALIIKIQNWRKGDEGTKEIKQEAKDILKIYKELKRGMSGEDVKLLQEMLATDPDIYPEGFTTGYFGPLTEKAVKKFQALAGIEEDGVVGSKTLSKINELLEEGAGSSGKVPPGLLIAPGIRKKLGQTPKPPEDQELPPGIQKKLDEDKNNDDDDDDEEEDNETPVISDISVIDVTTSSAMVTWETDEESNSIVWHDVSTPLVIDDATKVEDLANVLDHEIALFELIPGTNYYYQVSSADILDNITNSSEMMFTTLSE